MLFSHIGLIDENYDYRPDSFIGVKDSRIAYIGAEAPAEDYGEVYDGKGKVLMPGLYNAHAHVPMTLLRGYAENLPLDKWLNDRVWPYEAKITDEMAYPATLLGIAEMLRFGTVSFSDMYYMGDTRAKAVIESGIKCNMCEGTLNFEPIDYRETPFYEKSERLIKEYHGAADGRLLMELCVHAEYTSTPLFVRTTGEVAREHGIGIQVHVSETKKEHEECKQRHDGLTPVAYLAGEGLFDSPTTAAHCVWIEGDDFDILREKDVTVATCPASNTKLGSGIADDITMREHGVRVALGTDGPASNNNHNMFKDMYLLALLRRGMNETPIGITPKELLQTATANGAYAQRRADCGCIKVGNHADLIVLDIDVPWMKPQIDMLNNLAFAAQGSDVVLTMVDGAVLYRDGEYPTIDVEKAAFETGAAHEAIVAELAKGE